MKKKLKKNQIIITALALMIAVAGYVSYTRSNLDGAATETSADISEDSYEISDNPILEGDIFTDTGDGNPDVAQAENGGTDVALDEDAAEAGADAAQSGAELNPGEAVLTSSTVNNVDFAAEMKLSREQVRAKNKETLLGIVNSTTLTDEQKQAAVDQMIALTDVAEREAAAEMLLEAKGFTDVVVSITEDMVDVVLNMGDVTDAKRAQIEDIVKRKTNISAEHIVITPIDTTAQTESGTQTESETQQDSGTQTEGSETAGTSGTAEMTESTESENTEGTSSK